MPERSLSDILHKSPTSAYLGRISKSYEALHYHPHSSFLLRINHAFVEQRESRAAVSRATSKAESGYKIRQLGTLDFLLAPQLWGCFGRPVIKLRSYFQLIIVKVRERGALRRTSGGQSVKECHFDSARRAAGSSAGSYKIWWISKRVRSRRFARAKKKSHVRREDTRRRKIAPSGSPCKTLPAAFRKWMV